MNRAYEELLALETETVEGCILCQTSADSFQDDRFVKLLGINEKYSVQRCRKCGLRWLSPRPTKAAYDVVYSDKFYFGGQSSPECYEAVVGDRLHHFDRRLNRIRELLGRGRAKIMDVGAATGDFLRLARDRYDFEILGLEPSADARSSSLRKNGVELKDLDLASVEPETIDVVHMNHVLEHTQNPRECIASCYKSLKRGGVMVIEVPQQFDNDLDRLKRLLGVGRKIEFNSYSLHHTFFFSLDNLKSLLDICGFDVLTAKTAVSSRTPLFPFSMKMLFLRLFLFASDSIHGGGNVIEVYARKNR